MLCKKTILIFMFLCIHNTVLSMYSLENTKKGLIAMTFIKACMENNETQLQTLLKKQNITSTELYKALRYPNIDLEKQPKVATILIQHICDNITNMSAEVLSEALSLALALKLSDAAIVLLNQIGNGLAYGKDEAVLYYQSLDSSLEECAKTANIPVLQAILNNKFIIDGSVLLRLIKVGKKQNQNKVAELILTHLCKKFKKIYKESTSESKVKLKKWATQRKDLCDYFNYIDSPDFFLKYIKLQPDYYKKKPNHFTRALRFDNMQITQLFLKNNTKITLEDSLNYALKKNALNTLWFLYAYYLRNGKNQTSQELINKAKKLKLTTAGRLLIDCKQIFYDLSCNTKRIQTKKQSSNFVGSIAVLPNDITSMILTWCPAYLQQKLTLTSKALQ